MTLDVEELYERIAFYRTKLYEREDIEDVIKGMLLKSNMPIGEVSKVYYILNLPDNKQPYECEFRQNENELMRILDIPMKYKEMN